MLLKLLTIAYGGVSGHHGGEATIESLTSCFRRRNMPKDAECFVAECIHCMMAKTYSKVPRPLDVTLHGDRPTHVIHFHYLFLETSVAGNMYLLVVKDDINGYWWLEPTVHETVDYSATVLGHLM